MSALDTQRKEVPFMLRIALSILSAVGLLLSVSVWQKHKEPAVSTDQSFGGVRVMDSSTAASITGGCDCEESVANGCPECTESEDCPAVNEPFIWCFADGTKCGSGGTKNCSDQDDGPCFVEERFSAPDCGGESSYSWSQEKNRRVIALTDC